MAASLILVAGVVAAWWQLGARTAAGAPLKITRLTTSGQVRHAVASPDGRYVAYVALGPDGQSLWVRQMTASSRVLVVPPAAVNYAGLTVSLDGNAIFYVVREPAR